MQLLDQGIRDGRWPPMIMVCLNGGRTTFYKDSSDGKILLEIVVIKELIHHIDATFFERLLSAKGVVSKGIHWEAVGRRGWR